MANSTAVQRGDSLPDVLDVVLEVPADAKHILSCPLFSALGRDALKLVQDMIKVQAVEDAGHVVFSTGDEANEMYFVVSGQVRIQTTDGVQLAIVDQGSYFGELGVLFEDLRTADAVVSQGPCQLGVLSRNHLRALKEALGERHWNKILACGQDLAHVREWFVKRTPLFESCSDDFIFISHVAQALKVRTAKKKDTLMREGEEGHEMFFVFRGSVEITSTRRPEKIQRSAPDHLGELALLYKEQRSATVKCASDCRLYSLDRDALQCILQRFPAAISHIYSTAQEAASLKEHFIRKIPLFKSMAHNREFVQNLSLALQSESAQPNEYIIHEGESSDGRMFAIAHGQAEVLQTKAPGEAPVTTATLKAGDFFGEVALLLDTPRVASVVARGNCHIYTLSRDAFETLAVVYENWWKQLTSERGELLKKVKSSGVAIDAASTTQTHGLKLPKVAGVKVSTLLNASQGERAARDSISEEKVCVVCRDAEKCMLSIPCGHIATCESCHAALRACPLCRAPITQGHKAFF